MGGDGRIKSQASIRFRGPFIGREGYPFLSGRIAHHIIRFLGIRLRTSTEEEAVAAVQQVNLLAFWQEREGGVNGAPVP